MENESNQALKSKAMRMAEAVANDILEGMSLREAVKRAGTNVHEFHAILAEDQKAAAHYARAQEFRADILADEIIHIADQDGDSGVTRNKIEARKWIASKLKPKTYGDRIDLNVSQTLDIAGTLALAQQRLRPAHDLIEHNPPQVIDSIAVSIPEPLDKQSNSAPVAVQVPDIFD